MDPQRPTPPQPEGIGAEVKRELSEFVRIIIFWGVAGAVVGGAALGAAGYMIIGAKVLWMAIAVGAAIGAVGALLLRLWIADEISLFS